MAVAAAVSKQLSRIQMRTTTTTPACFRYMLLIWFKWYESDGHDVGVVDMPRLRWSSMFEDTSDLVILRRANGLISGWDSGSRLPISRHAPWSDEQRAFRHFSQSRPRCSLRLGQSRSPRPAFALWHPAARRRQRDEGCQEEEEVGAEEPWENSSRVYYFCWNWGQIYVYT